MQDINGETLLHHASLNGHREVVELLLKLEASTNIPDQKGCYPLHLAAWRGNATICEILLTRGPSVARVNVQNHEGDTALHAAAQYGHTAVVSRLLQCPDNGQSVRDKSPLHLAARNGHRDVVLALLDAGFNINRKTDDGTALHEAALFGRVDVVRLLLERGIDVEILDCANKTALAIVSGQKTLKSQEIEAIIKEHVRACLISESEVEYDPLPLPRTVTQPQPEPVGESCSRDSVISGEGSPLTVCASRQAIPSISSEEESLYDRPPAHARVVIPSIPSSSAQDTAQPRSPNTPQKPPRKKPVNAAMVKGTSLEKEEPHVSTSSEDQYRSNSLGEPVDSPDIHLDNNNDIVLTDAVIDNNVEIQHNADNIAADAVTSRVADDNSSCHVGNNNNIIQPRVDVSNVTAPTSITQCVGGDVSSVEQSSGQVKNTRPETASVESVANQRPPDINLASKRSTCVVPTVIAPSSPTHYTQPPTPEHPPPSPMTAILGIEEKINPKNRRLSRDMETITESEYLGGNENLLAPADRLCTVDAASGKRTAANHQQEGDCEVAVCVSGSDKNPFVGLTKGSITASGIHRRSSDSKVPPLPTRFAKRDAVGNKEAKRISAPPTLSYNSMRVSGERLEPLSEAKHDQCSVEPSNVLPAPVAGSKERIDVSKSVYISTSVHQSNADQLSSVFVDEMEEWGKIEDIISSIGSGLDAETLVKEFNERMCSVHRKKEDESIQSVGEWLADLCLPQYENTLVGNGFDNIDFMGADVMDENDLLDIGILTSEHRRIILEASSKLPSVQVSGHTTLKDWLGSLQLADYYDSFVRNDYVDMNRVRQIWEVDLTALIGIPLLGHRKRILASLKNETHDSPSPSSKTCTNSFSERHPDFLEVDHVSTGLRLAVTEIHLWASEEGADSGSSVVSALQNWNAAPLRTDEDGSAADAAVMRSKPTQNQCPSENPSYGANGDLEEAGASGYTESSSGNQWYHRPESLIKGRCNYTAQYLGSTLVTALEGTESTKASIYRLKRSTQNIAKIPSIVLSISYKGVKFIDPLSKQVICEHEIGNIFCACQDADDLTVFAYITRDLATDKHYCHVFSVYSTALATEIILTLGEAFEVAYQVALHENMAAASHAATPIQNMRVKQPYSTAI